MYDDAGRLIMDVNLKNNGTTNLNLILLNKVEITPFEFYQNKRFFN